MGIFDGIIGSVLESGNDLLNEVDEFFTHRRVRGGIDGIQTYLAALKDNIARLDAQNQEILARLDKLPKQIRAIVQEIVDLALLNERYSKIRNISDDIFKLNNRRYYRIRKPGWAQLSSTITYLFDYENRLSKAFTLLSACELAMAATKGKAAPFIYKKVHEKNILIAELRDAQKVEIETQMALLKTLLDNTAYIQSHNLSSNLDDFDNLKLTARQNRNRNETRYRRECRTIHHACEPADRVCKDIPYNVVVPDTAFNNAKSAHVTRINSLIQTIHPELTHLSYLQGIIKRYDHYLVNLGQDTLAEMPVELFYDISPISDADEAKGGEAIDATSQQSFEDYYAEIPENPPSEAFDNISSAEDTEFFEVIKRPRDCW